MLSRCARGSRRVLGMSILLLLSVHCTAGPNKRMAMPQVGAHIVKNPTLHDARCTNVFEDHIELHCMMDYRTISFIG
uniref:Putative secreted protein n=1 Tax=Anopheles darlingi TaxID=43151 RepID=A0A2M4DI94_ANODA